MGAVENCFWNYFQGCHVNKDNFEKWLFSISMAINTQKATNKTSPCIVLNFLDRTEILQITSENFFQETKNVLTRFQDGQESWITFQYINSNDSKQKSRVLSQENSTSKAGIQVIEDVHHYSQHGQLVEYYPPYLVKVLSQLLKQP